MPELLEVDVAALAPGRFESVVTPAQFTLLRDAVVEARRRFAGVTIWNVNSTARGGGVAEMLRSLIGYIRGAGLDARWVVIPGNPEFFRVTKRIHNHLHGSAGDGGALDAAARAVYEATLAPTAGELTKRIRPGDIDLLHDPQTAALSQRLRSAGAHVVWRCHVGIDVPNEIARRAWTFLLPYVLPAEAYVFSRPDFAWAGLDPKRVWVIPPSIDAFSPKNIDMTPANVRAVRARPACSGAQWSRPRRSSGRTARRTRSGTGHA